MNDGKFISQRDGFVGTVIGSYTTREGHKGLVLQQIGTKVVHVYRREHLYQSVYGNWCYDPSLCFDKGFCPRDPNCGD